MSMYDYRASQHLATLDVPFYALILHPLRLARLEIAAQLEGQTS